MNLALQMVNKKELLSRVLPFTLAALGVQESSAKVAEHALGVYVPQPVVCCSMPCSLPASAAAASTP